MYEQTVGVSIINNNFVKQVNKNFNAYKINMNVSAGLKKEVNSYFSHGISLCLRCLIEVNQQALEK